MSIKTNFFDTLTYSPDDLINANASLITDGIYNVVSGDLATAQHSPANLSVDVAIGAATKNGYYIKSDAIENVVITANASGYNRIDIIVLDIDTTTKATTVKAVPGTPSSSPTAPLPTATQLVLAQVAIGNNVSVINTANITDKRVNVDILNSSLASRAIVIQPAWTAPTLLNGWVNLGSVNSIISYMKDTLGFVHLKGHGKTGAVGTIMFNLPVGCRPAETLDFATICSSGIANISITGAGNVNVTTGNTTWTGLDGITFKSEQ